MSLVWAWVCLIQWTPTWARFGSDFVTFSNHLAKWKKKEKPCLSAHIPLSKSKWSKQTIWEAETTKTLIICHLRNGKVLGKGFGAEGSVGGWGGGGVGGCEPLSFFPFSHTQGDLPSYTSEDKSPLGTQLTNTVWSDVVLDLCLEGCSSWWQSQRGDGSIAFCSVCCVTPSKAICSLLA